jgi:hypothetical protein
MTFYASNEHELNLYASSTTHVKADFGIFINPMKRTEAKKQRHDRTLSPRTATFHAGEFLKP